MPWLQEQDMFGPIRRIARPPVVSLPRIALAAALAVTSAFSNMAAAQSGSTLYTGYCRGCHGAAGNNKDNVLSGKNVDTLNGALNYNSNTMKNDASLSPLRDSANQSQVSAISAYLATFTVVTPPPAAGKLSLSSSLSFGSQALGTTSANKRVTVTNTGTGPVAVSSVTSNTSEFRVVANSCTTVAVGGTCSIDINFRPSDVGTRGGTVSVVSNGTGSPQGISVSGDGTATAPPPSGATVTIKEYFHAAFGHYFITASADEIAKLDAGQFVGWASTGRSFKAYQTEGAGTVAVCRFFTEVFAPKSSHFYAPRGTGCEPVFDNKDWKYEGDVFYVAEASDAGSCPAGTQPIYRLYNRGQTGAPNHRYTNDPAVRSQMLLQNFQPEGKGTEGVGFCAPL
jgi:cytochrome c553